MKSFLKFILSLLPIFLVSTDLLATESQLREVIVSHTDENNILQLYYVKEDGSSKRQITNSTHGCLQPAVSPNGRKIVYLQMSGEGMSILVSDIDGNNSKVLTKPGRNLIPSWFPDSKHIVWMNFKPGKDPAENSQLQIMNTETMDSRRLFSDPELIKFSNSMPVVSPQRQTGGFYFKSSGHLQSLAEQS